MAIAPITGFVKRRIITDIVIGTSLGTVMAIGFWYKFHTPMVAGREAYYAELAKKKSVEDEA